MTEATHENNAAPKLSALGKSVREARKNKGWTLEETAKLANIGRSTLSKIENNQTKPSFDIVNRITEVLGLKNPNLFLQSNKSVISSIRDVTKAGKGELKKTNTYTHELLCTELISKNMVPYVSTIKARDISDFTELNYHQGEEFMYVLSGELVLHTEHYKPLIMQKGDSVYYDSSMAHGCVSTSKEDAQVLWVSLQS
ncbi:MAG: helix-turn-helix transcriptional regulator [Rhizobiales bacterium]|nr:helix-turn-helix transcriptional regulator [Hyphomicrobiales bacterium]